MKVIVIASRKGGTSKTSTAHALGAGLKRTGNRVLYCDLDSQANLTYAIGAKQGRYSCMDMLTGKIPAVQVIQRTDQGDILPGSADLAAADTVLTSTGKEYRLRECLAPVRNAYDYVVIDTPAQLGTLTINALTAADGVIIPVQADIFSLQGMDLLADAIQSVKRYTNPALDVLGVLITRYNGRAVLSRDMRELLQQSAEQLGTKLFNTVIRECISVKEAATVQQDIFSYAPRSNAAKDCNAFLSELLNERTIGG